MSVTTEVIWAMEAGQSKYPSDIAANQLQTKIVPFITSGKTTVEATKTVNSDNNLVVVRNWIDEASANEWLSIVAEYNPVSAVIV